MAFYNDETVFPNLFLLQNRHNQSCFCVPCRHRKAAAIIDRQEGSLRRALTIEIPNERENRSNSLLEVTKKQIVYGKLYKDICMANTHYKYFKCRAKRQAAYQPYLNDNGARKIEFNRHCQLVNDASYCYDNWEKIVGNLTDHRIDAIDARSFSVRYFSMAGNIDWCLEYNDKVRKSGRSQVTLYSQAQVDDIFRHILGTRILDDVEFNEQVAASIGSQIQRKMVSYCRRHRQ